MPDQQTSTPKDVQGLITTLDEYFVKKAPFQIPDGGKEMIVRFGPWIALILLLVTLPLILLALGVGTFLIPFAGVNYAASFGIAVIFGCIEIVMIVVALPGLFARKISGWNMMFYERLLSIVGGLLSGSIVGPIIGGIIGLYILFQVREKYH